MRTVDPNTSAALPGQLEVSRSKYRRYYGLLQGACSFLPFGMHHLPVLGWRVFQWTRAQEHLRHGCLNPAVVLDRSKGTVAVFTNLGRGGPSSVTPVIKIHRERLDLIGGEVANGDRFAAASLYYPRGQGDFRESWADFDPIIVNCLSDDEAACAAAAGRISDLAWKALELGLASLPFPLGPGLYPVKISRELVWNAY